MKKYNTIVESSSAPSGRELWIDKNQLKHLYNGKWTIIGNCNNGGGSEVPEETRFIEFFISSESSKLENNIKSCISIGLNKVVPVKIIGKYDNIEYDTLGTYSSGKITVSNKDSIIVFDVNFINGEITLDKQSNLRNDIPIITLIVTNVLGEDLDPTWAELNKESISKSGVNELLDERGLNNSVSFLVRLLRKQRYDGYETTEDIGVFPAVGHRYSSDGTLNSAGITQVTSDGKINYYSYENSSGQLYLNQVLNQIGRNEVELAYSPYLEGLGEEWPYLVGNPNFSFTEHFLTFTQYIRSTTPLNENFWGELRKFRVFSAMDNYEEGEYDIMADGLNFRRKYISPTDEWGNYQIAHTIYRNNYQGHPSAMLVKTENKRRFYCAELEIGDSETVSSHNRDQLMHIQGHFFCTIDYGYGVGTFQDGIGGFAHVTTAYGDEVFYEIHSSGAVYKEENYIKPDHPIRYTIDESKIGVTLSDIDALHINHCSQLIVSGSTGNIIYNKTVDSTPTVYYFASLKKDGSIQVLSYDLSSKTINASIV